MKGHVRVSGLGKRYKRFPNQWARLSEILSAGVLRLHQDHWALRGLDFEVTPGQAVGIVGANGAGKSTLLKILTGTTQPTEGRFESEGHVTALLELGMGFHDDFTGRQNAVMGLQLHAAPPARIPALLDEIADFSELRDHMDQPFRTYSSGMQIRLAFSVATAVRPDILIVDEALSVGDAYFQHKSIERIRDFKAQGTTLLFVSHDAAAVRAVCDRALLLDKGTLVHDGTPGDVLDYYNALISKRERDMQIRQVESVHGRSSTRSGTQEATIAEAELLSGSGTPARAFRVGETAVLKLRISAARDLDQITVGILLRDRLGNNVFGTNTLHQGLGDLPLRAGESLEVRFTLPLHLGPGSYALTGAVHGGHAHVGSNYDWWDRMLAFQVTPGSEPYFEGLCALPVTVGAKRLSAPESESGPGQSHREPAAMANAANQRLPRE